MTFTASNAAPDTEDKPFSLRLGKRSLSFVALALLITLFSTLLNTAALTFEKVIDDFQLIDSHELRGCGANPIECFQKPVFGLYYRPILSASFSLGVRWYGNQPFPHHLTNLLLHAVAMGLVFWFFRLLFRRDLPALYAGTLYALHPLQVPATTFIGGRTDTLALIGLTTCGIGLMLATYTREKGKGKREKSPGVQVFRYSGIRRWACIFASVLGFAFAVFTKEQCIPLLLLVPLLAATQKTTESGGRKRGDAARTADSEAPPREKETQPTDNGARKRENVAQSTENAAESAEKKAESTEKVASLRDNEANLRETGTRKGDAERHRGESPAPIATPLFPFPFSLFPVWWLLYLLPVAAYLMAANKIIPRNSYEPANWHTALHIEMVGRTLWYYAKALFFPTVRTLHQSLLGQWDTPQIGIAVLGFLCATVWVAALRFLWENRVLRFCWLWTTLTLVSCLNIIPTPSQFVAPYRAVIPVFGVTGLLGFAFAAWQERRQTAPASEPGPAPTSQAQVSPPSGEARVSSGTGVPAFFLLLCLLMSCVSLADVPYWHNEVRLVGMEIEADPDYLPAQIGLAGILQKLGVSLETQGHHAEAMGRYQEARAQYDRVMEILFPGAKTPEERIMRVHSPALYRFLRGGMGLRYKPLEHLNLGVRGSGGTYQALGKLPEAIEDYRVALAAKPDDYELRDYLALAYYQMGRYPEAESVVQETLRRAPTATRRVQLAEILLREGRREKAQEVLLEVMMGGDWNTLQASEKRYVTTLYNAASVKKTAPSIK